MSPERPLLVTEEPTVAATNLPQTDHGEKWVHDGQFSHGGTRAFLNRTKNRRQKNKAARASRKRNRR